MRSFTTRAARCAARAVQLETRTSIRGPFICASCRTATTQSTRNTSPTLSRAFSSATQHRQQAPSAASQKETIAPQTYFDFFPEAFPDGPPPTTPFTPDLKKLRKEFLQLQAKSHPDLVASEKKQQAEALSARINEAYRTLLDPLKRAQYLLQLNGIDVEDESAKLTETMLLMEVMEAREAVDEVETEEELGPLKIENDERMAESVRILEERFSKGDMEQAAQEAIRLRYWKNIEESIHGWERGKGGGAIHH